jgi:hypothetical protein
MDEQIEKYFGGKLNAPERLALLNAIASDPEKKELYIKYKNILGLVSSSDELSSRCGYERFFTRIRQRKTYRIIRNTCVWAKPVTTSREQIR